MLKLLPFLAAFLMWSSFEPLGIGLLIIPAALCWLLLIRVEVAFPKNSYKLIYAGSALAWLALLQGIRLAYWPLYAGWIALSLYVAVYIPLFVLVSRYLVHRWRWPLCVAAPIVWAGTELLRCYILTGFGGCLLSHAMADHPSLIQLASHIGPQLLSGLFIFYAAFALELSLLLPSVRRQLEYNVNSDKPFANELGISQKQTLPTPQASNGRAKRMIVMSLIVIGSISSSYWTFWNGQILEDQQQPMLKVALIQENAETRFEYSQEKADASFDRYVNLTAETGKHEKDIDLVVWPESIFTPSFPYFDWDGKKIPNSYAPYVGDPQTAYDVAAYYRRLSPQRLEWLQECALGKIVSIGELKPPQDPTDPTVQQLPALLVGLTRHKVREAGFDRFNSVAFKAKGAGPIGFYDKRRLVMFGEFIPFADKWPKLYESLGMAKIGVGPKWEVFDVDGVKVAPSICFEDMLPHVMQSQTASLIREGTPPDLLVNVTNDGWFRGSSILDHHFACAVFSALENRRPMVVAANTGISTWVSGNGVVKLKSQKLIAEALIAYPTADGRWGLWQTIGDLPAWPCAALIVYVLLDMLIRSQIKQFQQRRSAFANNSSPS